jgi:magnesium-transporting ATPase (P-type)
MNDKNYRPGVDESRSALATIREAQSRAIASTRGSIWWTLLATVLLAVVLLGNWVLVDYKWIAFPAMLALFATWFAYVAALRRKGLKIRFIPSSPAGRWLLLGQVIVYLSLVSGGHWLVERGHTWASWVATAIICACFAATLHFCPTGDPVTRLRNS